MASGMTIKYLGNLGLPHRCDLPRRGPFWNRNPICVEGSLVECQTCHKKYVWTWFGYAETWDWTEFEPGEY